MDYVTDFPNTVGAPIDLLSEHGRNSIESDYRYSGVLGFGLKELACFIDSSDPDARPVLVDYDHLNTEVLGDQGVRISAEELWLAEYALHPDKFSPGFLTVARNEELQKNFNQNAADKQELAAFQGFDRQLQGQGEPLSVSRHLVFTGQVFHFKDDPNFPKAAFITLGDSVVRLSREELLDKDADFKFPLSEAERNRALEILDIDPESPDVTLVSGGGSFLYEVSPSNP